MKRSIKISLVTGGLFFALTAVFCLSIFTAQGRKILVDSVAPSLASAFDYKVHIDGVRSETLGTFHIQTLNISHNGQKFLTVNALDITWVPRILFIRQLHVQSVTAQSVAVHLPEQNTLPKASSTDGWHEIARLMEKPTKIWPIQLDKTSFGAISVTGVPHLPRQDYKLTAQNLRLFFPDQIATGRLEMTSGLDEGFQLSIEGQLTSPYEGYIHGKLREKPSGLVAHMLTIPVTHPLSADIRLEYREAKQVKTVTITQAHVSVGGQTFSTGGIIAFDPLKDKIFLKEIKAAVDKTEITLNGGILHRQKLEIAYDIQQLSTDTFAAFLPNLPLKGTFSDKGKLVGTLSLPKVISENLSFKGSLYTLPLEVSTRYVLTPREIELQTLRAEVNGTVLSTVGKVAFFEGNSQLNLTVEKLPLDYTRYTGIILPRAISGVISGAVKITGNIRKPEIKGQIQLNGRLGDHPAQAVLEGGFSLTNETVSIDKGELAFPGKGKANLSGKIGREALDVSLQAYEAASSVLDLLGLPIAEGSVNADLRITGTPFAPVISGSMGYEAILEVSGEKSAFSMKADFSQSRENTAVDLILSHNGEKIGFLKALVPLKTYLQALEHTPGAVPLTGRVEGDIDLATLSFLLSDFQHRLSGHLKGDIKLAGTLDKPAVKGRLNLENGFYENLLSGTILNDFNAVVSGDNGHVSVTISATDGLEGKLSLMGRVNIGRIYAPEAVSFMLDIHSANLLRRADMDGKVSGQLSLTGNAEEFLLAGEVGVRPLKISLDALLADDIPELNIASLSANGDNGKTRGFLAKYLPTVKMDVVLKAEQQAYISGYGLEMELAGQIHITGPLQRPSYLGGLKTVRGRYEIIGKKFDVRDGQLRIEQENLFFNVKGIHKTKDKEIMAALSGTLDKPNLELTSRPPMPQDEVVSFLLFGKSSANISPFQAIRLANALQSLRRSGKSVFDPVTATKTITGIDELSVDTQKTENGQEITFSAGKYLSEKVYIELERGENPVHPWKGNVEIELTPSVNLESSTGGTTAGAGNVRLLWKRDY